MTFTKARLEKIAEIQNNRIAETGDATPIIIGHSRRHLMEKDQPPLTGWATNFEVVPFQGSQYGLRATPWALPSEKQNFAKYPRRSVELWTNPDVIDPISLLGATTPMQDLGTPHLKLSKKGDFAYLPRTPLLLEMTMPDDAGTPPTPTDKATPDNVASSEGDNSADMAQLKAQMAQVMEVIQLLQPFLDELKGGTQDGTVPGGAPGGAMPMGAPPGGAPGGPPGGAPAGPPTLGGPPMDIPQQQSTTAGMGNQMIPQQMSRQDPRDNIIMELQTQVAQLQLSRLEDSVSAELKDVATKVMVSDFKRDLGRLVKMSKGDRDAEYKVMLAERKPIEQTAGLAVGVRPEHQAVIDSNQPIQLQKAMDGFFMPGDPAMAATTAEPDNMHDRLVNIIRNRGKKSMQEVQAELHKTSANGSGRAGVP